MGSDMTLQQTLLFLYLMPSFGRGCGNHPPELKQFFFVLRNSHLFEKKKFELKNWQNYWVTQNKVHHLLAILYLIFEVNNTQVSYVIQCIIVNEVQFNEIRFWKCLSERNISNCAVIWKMRDLKYLSRFSSYEYFLLSWKCQSSVYVWKSH